MKKALSLSLLLELAVHVVGFYVYFTLRMMEIRQQKRYELSLLPTDQLDLIEVDRADFQPAWEEEMEMQWNNRMYDIARIEKTDSVVKIYCKHDADEDDLLALMNKVAETAGSDKKPVPSSLLSFLSLVFIPTQGNFHFCSTVIALPETPYVNSYNTLSYPIDSPPPRA